MRAHLLNHADESSRSEGSTREAKDEDAVSRLVVLFFEKVKKSSRRRERYVSDR